MSSFWYRTTTTRNPNHQGHARQYPSPPYTQTIHQQRDIRPQCRRLTSSSLQTQSPRPSGLAYQSSVRQATQPRSPSSHSGMTRAEVGCTFIKINISLKAPPQTTYPIRTRLSIAKTPGYPIFFANPPPITLLLLSSSFIPFPRLLSPGHVTSNLLGHPL